MPGEEIYFAYLILILMAILMVVGCTYLTIDMVRSIHKQWRDENKK